MSPLCSGPIEVEPEDPQTPAEDEDERVPGEAEDEDSVLFRSVI